MRYRTRILFSSQEGKKGGRQETQCWNFKNCPSASSLRRSTSIEPSGQDRAIDATHFSKVRSYLRAVNKQHGLILNFALPRLEIKRVISSAKPLPQFLTSCLPERKKGKEAGPEDAEPLE